MNMKSSLCVYPYQSFTHEQMILSHEIVTRCVSLSIIKKRADDSINEYEIITMCTSLGKPSKQKVWKNGVFLLLSVFDPF